VPSELAHASWLFNGIADPATRGFCLEIGEYLVDACGVNRGDGSETGGPNRTILWGLQRPPLNGQKSVLRCDKDMTLDELAPTLLPFLSTNACDSLVISCDGDNAALLEVLKANLDGHVPIVEESNGTFGMTCVAEHDQNDRMRQYTPRDELLYPTRSSYTFVLCSVTLKCLCLA
jgi:hypothetical protein